MPRASKATEEQWVEARLAYSRGDTNGEIAQQLGVSAQYVGQISRRQEWQRDDATVEARAEERRLYMERAKVAADRAWAIRRKEEANAAGITASYMRQKAKESADQGDDKMLRATTQAYETFVVSAERLDDRVTVRIGQEDPRERAQGILDELAAKRDEKRSA